jgi:hypothetical protein
MTEVFSAMLEASLVFALAWVGIFGGLGAILALKLGAPIWLGLLSGVLVGPIGWILTWAYTEYLMERPTGEAEDDFDSWGADHDSSATDHDSSATEYETWDTA